MSNLNQKLLSVINISNKQVIERTKSEIYSVMQQVLCDFMNYVVNQIVVHFLRQSLCTMQSMRSACIILIIRNTKSAHVLSLSLCQTLLLVSITVSPTHADMNLVYISECAAGSWVLSVIDSNIC